MPKTLPVIDLTAPVWCAPVSAAPLTDEAALEIALRLKALADPVRIKLMSILLTAEMSGSLSHLLPVALVVIIAAFTADALRVPPIYEALLERRLRAENAVAAS